MMKWHLVENVKHWAYRRPPMVVFVLSISSLAIAFLSLGIYIRSHQVASLDDTRARNTFLKSLSQQEFCTYESQAASARDAERLKAAEANGGATRRQSDLDALSRPPGVATLSSENPVDVSLLVPMTFDLKPVSKVASSDLTYLRALVNGSLFGLTDSEAKESISISLALPWRPDLSRVNSSTTKTPLTCLTMTAAVQVLPQALKYFPSCKSESFTRVTSPRPRAGATEGSMKTKPRGRSPVQCYRAQYTADPTFSVQLSEEERALSGRHLVATSYALFLLAMVIFCLSAVCGLGRKTSPKALNLHKAQLSDL